MTDYNRPKVGVGIYVCKDGKVLVGMRKGAHADSTWCAPGGHLEKGESWEQAARREVLEETGMEIKNVRYCNATNDIYPDGRHYITIQMVADWKSGEAQVLEPEKMNSAWEWRAWDDMPKPRMLSFENFINTGYNPTNF